MSKSQFYSLLFNLWRAPSRPKLTTGKPSPATVRVSSVSAIGTVKSGPFDRNTLVYGQYNPKETGYYGPNPGTKFTTLGGPLPGQEQDFVVTKDGQEVSNMIIYGQILIGSFSNVYVHDCIIYSRTQRGSNFACIFAQGNNYRGLRVVDTRFTQRPNYHNEWVNPLIGGNFTAERCEVDNMPDGFGLNQKVGNVTLLGNYMHDGWFNEWTAAEGALADGSNNFHGEMIGDDSDTSVKPTGYYPYSHGTDNYTHTDCIQFYITSNVLIRGNYLGGHHVPGAHNATPSQKSLIRTGHDYYNSCILLKQEGDSSAANKITAVQIDHNWFYGAVASVNIPYSNSNKFETCYLNDNYFLKADWTTPYYVLLSRDETGTPIANFSTTTNRLVDPVTYADLGAVPITRGN